ncbi:hypothetical protein Tco_0641449 [Tanacetum coccineum]
MEAEVPQTLQYRGGQLNFAPLLDVENFTNWKQRFLFHIVGIEPQFKKIITNGPYFPMATVGVPKPEPQWPTDERKKIGPWTVKFVTTPSDTFKVGASCSKYIQVKNKGLVVEANKWDKEDVSSNDKEMVEVKVLIALHLKQLHKRHVRQKPSSTKKEATFIGPLTKEASKAPKGHSKKKSSLTKDLNPSQPSVSTLVVTEVHKGTPQATSDQMSLGLTGEEKAYSQLSSVVSTSTTKPIDTTSVIIHSESASGGDALASLIVGADPGQSDPNKSLPQKESQKAKMEEEKKVAKAEGQNSSAHLPAELKVLPEKMDAVTKYLANLKEYIEKLELDFPSELKEIPAKVEKLECFKLKLPANLIALPGTLTNVSSQVEKLKVLDVIPDIINKVFVSLDRFADAISSASNNAETFGVPSSETTFTLLVGGEGENVTNVDERPRNQPNVAHLFQ